MVRAREGLMYFTVGLVLGAALFVNWDYFFEKVPYTSVKLNSIERQDHWVHLHFTFNKKDCVFKKLVVVGKGFGVTELLRWHSLGVSKNLGDRIKGLHSWRFRVYAPKNAYDQVEIRTRHDCEGELVDKVFNEIEVTGI